MNSDGKAQMNRFKVDLERASQLAQAEMSKYKGLLDKNINSVALVTSLPLFKGAKPDVDPVTEITD